MKRENNIKCNVYVGMVVDLLHEGHINILKYASSLGDVMVGLLTDECLELYKRRPIQSWENRKTVVESIKYVSIVVPQTTLSYKENLLQFKPTYVVHGDDWREGPQKKTRDEVIETLKLWNGTLHEPEYTPNVSTTSLLEKIRSH